MKALFNALSEDGILMMQLGEAAIPGEPSETISKYRNRDTMRNLLRRVGFQSLHVYDEVSISMGKSCGVL